MPLKDYDDPNYIVKVEKAIAKKYGYEAIQNPKATWTQEKEKEYLKQVKDFYARQHKLDEKSEKVEVDGIFVPKKLLNKKSDSCFKCYIKYVEYREERWLSGWRPE